jgi:hypothetical protein
MKIKIIQILILLITLLSAQALVLDQPLECIFSQKNNGQHIIFSVQLVTIAGKSYFYDQIEIIYFKHDKSLSNHLKTVTEVLIILKAEMGKESCKIDYEDRWLLGTLLLELPPNIVQDKIIFKDILHFNVSDNPIRGTIQLSNQIQVDEIKDDGYTYDGSFKLIISPNNVKFYLTGNFPIPEKYFNSPNLNVFLIENKNFEDISIIRTHLSQQIYDLGLEFALDKGVSIKCQMPNKQLHAGFVKYINALKNFYVIGRNQIDDRFRKRVEAGNVQEMSVYSINDDRRFRRKLNRQKF